MAWPTCIWKWGIMMGLSLVFGGYRYFEKTFGKFSLDYAMLLSDFGDLYAKMGSYMTAEQLLLDAKDILEKTNNTTHPNYAIALFKLANLYLDMGHSPRLNHSFWNHWIFGQRY